MEKKMHYVMSFYHLSLAVRDTLEYVQNRENYPLDAYKAKANSIKAGLAENSPFVAFCENNGEVGQKVLTQMKDLYNLVYGERPRFIHIEEDKLTVDHSQNIKVLDLIIPLKVSLYNIILAYVNQMSEEEKDLDCMDLVELEYKYFAIVIAFIISDYLLNDRFVKFNQEMRDNKGQESVESNFTVSEMQKLVGMYGYIKENIGKRYSEFNNLDDQFSYGVDLISGKKKPEGEMKLLDAVKVVPATYQREITPIEREYKLLHQKVWKKLIEFENNLRNQEKN